MVGDRVKDYSEEHKTEVTLLLKKDGVTVKAWPNWKLLEECSEEEIKESNLIKVGYTEVVLDVDSQEKLESCIIKLEEDNFSYEVWNSGSEGHYHIYLDFEELKWLRPEVNSNLKKFLIKLYLPNDNQALSKGNNRNCIQQKNKPHFKLENDGRIKSLVKKIDKGLNIFSGSILFEFLNSFDTPPFVVKVEDVVDSGVDKSSLEIFDLLKGVPKVFVHYQRLDGVEKPSDRSGSDFAIVKCLIEKGVSKESILNFLKLLRWSDVHFKDRSYFGWTYHNALRRVKDYERRCLE